MKGWLLDTNVLSELRKPRCNPNVQSWSDRQNVWQLYTSSVVIAEIRFGIDLKTDPSARQELFLWLETVVRPTFTGRVLEVDEEVILRWRMMVKTGRERGHNFSQPDLFLAAQADVHNLCLVTRNVADFQGTGVPVLNPWEHRP